MALFPSLFTSIDSSKTWPVVIPQTDASASSYTEALLNGWVSCFGVPDHTSSDRGPAFTSDLWLP